MCRCIYNIKKRIVFLKSARVLIWVILWQYEHNTSFGSLKMKIFSDTACILNISATGEVDWCAKTLTKRPCSGRWSCTTLSKMYWHDVCSKRSKVAWCMFRSCARSGSSSQLTWSWRRVSRRTSLATCAYRGECTAASWRRSRWHCWWCSLDILYRWHWWSSAMLALSMHCITR